MKHDHLLLEYPEVISSEQLYKILHYSKRKTRWLLENKFIKCKDSGKKTRRFQIKMKDVISYLESQDMAPMGFPSGNFGGKGNMKNYVPEIADKDNYRRFLEKEFSSAQDVFTTSDIASLLGYRLATTSKWVTKGRVKAIMHYNNHYLIPKEWLIDFLTDVGYHGIKNKSQIHRDLLNRYMTTL